MKVITTANSQSGQALAASLAYTNSDKTLYWGLSPANKEDPNNIYCGTYNNGVEQLELLSGGKIATPKFTTNLNEAIEWERNGLEVWGRKNNHTQGRDIRKFGHREWLDSDFWVVAIPQNCIISEWRLHTFNEKSIARGQKTQTELLARKLAPMVRSRRNGWRLDHTPEPPKGARFYAKNACDTLKYLWGATDMLMVDLNNLPDGCVTNRQELEKHKAKTDLQPFVVLEVNQKPGMDNYTLEAYTKAVQKYIEPPTAKVAKTAKTPIFEVQ